MKIKTKQIEYKNEIKISHNSTSAESVTFSIKKEKHNWLNMNICRPPKMSFPYCKIFLILFHGLNKKKTF